MKGSLAALACVLAALITALNLVFIPFHAPDDIDHFERAYMLARGEIWPESRPGVHSGGSIDTGLQLFVQQELPALSQWPLEGPLRRSLGPGAAGRAAGWSGEDTFAPSMAAAVTYFPLIYLPQTVAIWLGTSLGLSVESTIFWAREFNGLTAIGLAFWVLAAGSLPSAVVLLLLFLPKTLLHLASNSPDPIYYALVLAIISLVCRAGEPAGRARRWRDLGIAAAFLVICPVRPPAAALTLPVLAWARGRRAWFAASLVAGAVALSACWTLLILTSTVTDACADDHVPVATKVMAFLQSSYEIIPQTFYERGRYFLISMVGELGWGAGPAGLTAPLADWVYTAALAMFVLAVRVDLASPFSLPRGLRAAFAAAAAGMVFVIFLALYVTCSSYQMPIVRGVQGRYFVPVLICLVPVFAGLTAPRPAWRRAYDFGLVGFALAGFGTLLNEGLRIYWMR